MIVNISNNLSAVIYEDLRFQLIVGKMEPGDTLSIRTLAEQYNVSTMPIREALKRLESEKALKGAAKKAYRVPEVTTEEASNLFFIRTILEGAAAELAVKHLTDQDIDQACQFTMMLDEGWKQRDSHHYLENNFRFHSLIYRAANNPDLSDVIESLYARSGPLLGKAIKYLANFDDWETRHYEIIDALKSRNGAEARRLMEEDIRWGMLIYKQIP